MAYRSWLKDVRSVHDLGEHCNALTFRKPEDEKRDEAYDEKWLKRLNRDIPIAPEYVEFYGSRMHDSWIRSLGRDKGDLRLRLICFYADVFASTIAKILDVPEPIARWHVDLVLVDAAYVNAVKVEPGGKLRWTDWSKWREGEDVGRLDQFLHDWFFEQDARIQWIAVLWLSEASRDSNVYLLVDCKQAIAVDYRREAIRKSFSEPVAQLWDDVRARVGLTDESLYGGAMDDYLRRRIEARGWGIEELKAGLL